MKKWFTETQIIGFLKEAHAGVPVKELCRKHGFSGARSKVGGPSSTGCTLTTPIGPRRSRRRTLNFVEQLCRLFRYYQQGTSYRLT